MDEAANSPQLKPAPPEHGRPEQTVRPDSELDRSVAFAAFYRNGWHDLVAFVMWLGANLQDAQNIAQETMTRAYSRWETIDHPKTWIRTVVSHEYGRSAFAVHDDPVDELPEMPDHGSDEVALFARATSTSPTPAASTSPSTSLPPSSAPSPAPATSSAPSPAPGPAPTTSPSAPAPAISPAPSPAPENSPATSPTTSTKCRWMRRVSIYRASILGIWMLCKALLGRSRPDGPLALPVRSGRTRCRSGKGAMKFVPAARQSPQARLVCRPSAQSAGRPLRLRWVTIMETAGGS